MGRLNLTAALTLALLATGANHLAAQEPRNTPSPRLGARVVAFHQDAYTDTDAWSPGAEFLLRLPLGRFLTAEVSTSNAWTRRWNQLSCPAAVGIPCPRQKVTGWTGTLAASLEANVVLDPYIAYSGAGYGRMWDSQQGGMLEFGGPIWLWTVGVERHLGGNLALDLSYRLLRMRWDNDFSSILQGIHMTHHQLAVGVTYAVSIRGR